MRTRKAGAVVVRKNTPFRPLDAALLAPGMVIRTRSGEVLIVRAARKREGVVRCQFEGYEGIYPLPRTAPVNVYAVN